MHSIRLQDKSDQYSVCIETEYFTILIESAEYRIMEKQSKT